jgi:transposase
LSRGDLTDEQWRILDSLLPDRGERGPAIESKRRAVNGILWVLRTGAPWRDMPDLRAVHPLEQARRVGRRIRNPGESRASSRRGACHRFTIARAHQHAAGVKGQNQQALGRSRGGFSIKIHLRTNAKGNPLTFDVTSGEAHEVKGYDALMELHDNDPDRLLGDKGYDSDNIRNDLAERGIVSVIPPRSNRKVSIEYDREAYKRRNLIERCVNRLKQFRRIATRYEKTARAYLSMLCIASALIWIKTVNTA